MPNQNPNTFIIADDVAEQAAVKIGESSGIMRLITFATVQKGKKKTSITEIWGGLFSSANTEQLKNGVRHDTIVSSEDDLELKSVDYLLSMPKDNLQLGVITQQQANFMFQQNFAFRFIEMLIDVVKSYSKSADTAKLNTLPSAQKIGASGVDTEETINKMIREATKYLGVPSNKLTLAMGPEALRQIKQDTSLKVSISVNAGGLSEGKKEYTIEDIAAFFDLKEIVVIADQYEKEDKTWAEQWGNQLTFAKVYKKSDKIENMLTKRPSLVCALSSTMEFQALPINPQNTGVVTSMQTCYTAYKGFENGFYTELEPFAEYDI